MQTAKREVSDLLDRLPRDCSSEDIQHHLLVLQKKSTRVERHQ